MYNYELFILLFMLIAAHLGFSTPPNIILIGAPASGKGTFANYMMKKGYSHFSVGDHARQHIREKTPYGQKLVPLFRRSIEENRAPDSLMGEMRDDMFAFIFDFIRTCREQNKPFIVDNAIHSIEDISYLLTFLKEEEIPDLAIVYLYTDRSKLLERAAARRICPHCTAIYSLLIKLPIKPNICDTCEKALIQRHEDEPVIYEKRLDYHREFVEPVLINLIQAGQARGIPTYSFDAGGSVAQSIASYNTLFEP